MPKLPAQWTARDGSSTATQISGHLLLETSGGLLLESSGSYLLLEGSTVTPKEATLWGTPARPTATQYVAQDGYSSVTISSGTRRYEQDGVTIRTLEDGTVRVLEDATITPKIPAVWNNS